MKPWRTNAARERARGHYVKHNTHGALPLRLQARRRARARAGASDGGRSSAIQARVRILQGRAGPLTAAALDLLVWLVGNLELGELLDKPGVAAAGADFLERGEVGVELLAIGAVEVVAFG